MIKMIDGNPVEMTPMEIAEWEAAQNAPTPIPQSVSARQAKRALLEAGLLDQVETLISTQPREVQIDWADATEFSRAWPTLLSLQAALGLSDTELDNLFILASTK